MKISNESGEQQPATQCVAISRDSATCSAIAHWASGRQWPCQVESDPLLAWSKLLLIEKSKAERARWGLVSPGRTVLLIDDRACDPATNDRLIQAFDRYAPTASRITLHNGVLPFAANADPAWAAPADEVLQTTGAGALEDVEATTRNDESDLDEEDDGRLTADEIRMLLGDDTMEPVT